jgi:hypothetical protein
MKLCKRVEFVSDRMLYVILVLNVHASTEDNIDMKASFCEKLECIFDEFHEYHTKMLLAAFSAEVGREDIFKPTIGNESLHKISNDNGHLLVERQTN